MYTRTKYSKFLLVLIVILTIHSNSLRSQVVTWSVNFNNACAANCLATTYGGWTVQNNVGGVSGGASNNWFVSCAEEGVTPPGCGSACVGDACLHIGANAGAGGDMGSSFNETGINNATFKLAVSPVISLAGVSTNTLSFDYIAFGSAACANDRAQLWLSTDGGATWPVGYQYCLTSLCCGACNGYNQARWTLYTLPLPAAFDNNPNVLVGFHWRNDGNGVGTDPSVGIDDIRITSPVVVPLTLIEFKSGKENHKTKLDWTTMSEVNFKKFDIERSVDAKSFTSIGTVLAKGNGNAKTNYNFIDKEIASQTTYYRLKMIDDDNSFSYSKLISSLQGDESSAGISLLSQTIYNDNLNIVLHSKSIAPVIIEVYDVRGKQLISLTDEKLNPGDNKISVDVATLAPAVYFLKISSVVDGKNVPIMITEKIVRTK